MNMKGKQRARAKGRKEGSYVLQAIGTAGCLDILPIFVGTHQRVRAKGSSGKDKGKQQGKGGVYYMGSNELQWNQQGWQQGQQQASGLNQYEAEAEAYYKRFGPEEQEEGAKNMLFLGKGIQEQPDDDANSKPRTIQLGDWLVKPGTFKQATSRNKTAESLINRATLFHLERGPSDASGESTSPELACPPPGTSTRPLTPTNEPMVLEQEIQMNKKASKYARRRANKAERTNVVNFEDDMDVFKEYEKVVEVEGRELMDIPDRSQALRPRRGKHVKSGMCRSFSGTCGDACRDESFKHRNDVDPRDDALEFFQV